MSSNPNDLNQTTTWVSSSGKERRIDQMAPEHARNAAAWLERNATALLCQDLLRSYGLDPDISLSDLRGHAAPVNLNPTSQLGMGLALILLDPAGQMTHMPLHRALTERAAAAES